MGEDSQKNHSSTISEVNAVLRGMWGKKFLNKTAPVQKCKNMVSYLNFFDALSKFSRFLSSMPNAPIETENALKVLKFFKRSFD